MSHFLRLLCLACLALNMPALAAQNKNVLISDNATATPDNSAVLDVQSNNKGALFPRMNSAMRMGINNPAVGLLVFDTTTESFWYNTSSGWVNLSGDIWQPNGNSIVYTPDRKVGIGLNDPVGALHAKGDLIAEEDNSGNEGGFKMLDANRFERVHFNHQYFPAETRFRFEINPPVPQGVARIQFFRNTEATTKLVEFFRGDAATFGTERSAVIGVDGENSFFQNSGGNLGIGTETPDPNAILDVTSDSKGVLFPRMSTNERIALGNANPQNGLLVFDANKNTYWYWVNNAWVELFASGASVRDIAIFEERKPQGTCLSYGDNNANAVINRRLNTIQASSPNGSVTLLNPDTPEATLQFQPGKYLISASATMLNGGAHKLLLIDEVNQNQIMLTGTSELGLNTTTQTSSTILGIVPVGAGGQTMKLVHVYNNAGASCIFGTSAGVSGAEEVFARIMIEKIQ